MRLRNVPGSRDVIKSSEYCIHDPEQYKGHWAEVFGNDHPIYIEIGMGKGRFLMDNARQNPDINYIGIEMYSSVLIRAIEKAKEQERTEQERTEPERTESEWTEPERTAPERTEQKWTEPGSRKRIDRNFIFIRMDATYIEEVFAQGEIDRIYLNFSDPWPKERHAKRRLTSTLF